MKSTQILAACVAALGIGCAEQPESASELAPEGALHRAAYTGDIEAALHAIDQDGTAVHKKEGSPPEASQAERAARQSRAEPVGRIYSGRAPEASQAERAARQSRAEPVGRIYSGRAPEASQAERAARQSRAEPVGRIYSGRAPDEWTPLHYAAIAGRTEVASLLLDRGADPNDRSRYDMTPLHWASLKGHRDTVALLIRRGAKVDATNMYGQTALHEAGTTDVVDVLLTHGANLHAVDFDGMTPLHIARSGDIAKLLLSRGADIRLRSRDGRTGLDVAVMEMLGPLGLMFYGPRAPTRLRGDRAELSVVIRNVSERTFSDLELQVKSEVCIGTSSPAQIALLHPAEQTNMTFTLTKMPNAPEGEYSLDFIVQTGGVLLGTVDLKVDTTTSTIPEDLGMIRLGSGSVRKAGSRYGQFLYALIPLLILAIWFLARRKRSDRTL